MNRAQRRKFNKEHKTSYTKEELEVALALARLQSNGGIDVETLQTLVNHGVAHLDNEKLVPDGTIVKLNSEAILSRKLEDYTPEYIEWIKENKDKEFHLMREENAQSLVCLEEDNRIKEIDGQMVSCPKWMFDLYSDLLIKYEDEWITVWDYDAKINPDNDEKVFEKEKEEEMVSKEASNV